MIIKVIITGWIVEGTTFSLQTDNLVDLRLGGFGKITENIIELIGLNVVFELDVWFSDCSPCLHGEIGTNLLCTVSMLVLKIGTKSVWSLRK